jgi:hypothetical protein
VTAPQRTPARFEQLHEGPDVTGADDAVGLGQVRELVVGVDLPRILMVPLPLAPQDPHRLDERARVAGAGPLGAQAIIHRGVVRDDDEQRREGRADQSKGKLKQGGEKLEEAAEDAAGARKK